MKLIITLFLACSCALFAHAAEFRWGFDSQDAAFLSQWQDATAYGYIVTGSVTDFVTSWDSSYVADNSSVFGGLVASIGADGYRNYQVSNDFLPQTDVGSLVMILDNGTDVIYCWADNYVVVENVMTPMDEEALGFFTENGYDSSSATGGSGGTWTYLSGGTVDPNVPEPTALALLALGVAGVALRRRVA